MLTSDETCHLQAALPEGGLYDVPLHFPRCVQEMPGYDMFAEHSTHMKKALLDSVNAAATGLANNMKDEVSTLACSQHISMKVKDFTIPARKTWPTKDFKQSKR
ncbi:unnamed protein product [Aphanomyces euteiches]